MLSWKETVEAHAGAEPPLVLFFGRTNAATSILAEAILRHLDGAACSKGLRARNTGMFAGTLKLWQSTKSFKSAL